jgi:hypothetical protein
MKRSIIILAMAILLIAVPVLAENTPGVNYHFSHQDGSGTKAGTSYNPDGPGTGWSYRYDSGNTQNSDGSFTYTFGNDGNGISIRTEPVWGSDD